MRGNVWLIEDFRFNISIFIFGAVLAKPGMALLPENFSMIAIISAFQMQAAGECAIGLHDDWRHAEACARAAS